MNQFWKSMAVTTAAGAVGAATFAVVNSYLQSKIVDEQILAAKYPPPYTINGKSKVSIVIPALQEEDYLPELLTSIKHQTYSPIETIVSDSSTGASKRKTQDICSKFGSIYTYIPKLNVAAARNAGAREATGTILCFIDADCILANNYVESMVKELENGAVLAHGADPYYGKRAYEIWGLIGRKLLKPKTWTTGRGVTIWKEAFDRLGGYNPEIDPTTGAREDLDLGHRVAAEYGADSISLLRDVYIAESTRRAECWPFASWDKVRGVR